jgi:S1-C subfamily serine protease
VAKTRTASGRSRQPRHGLYSYGVWHHEDGGDDAGENGAEAGRSGPLPDPDSRHWRHPSELRRDHALPHPDPTPLPMVATLRPSTSLRWPLMAVGGCLAVAAVGALSLRTPLAPSSSLQTAAGTTTLPEWVIGMPGGTLLGGDRVTTAEQPQSAEAAPVPPHEASTTVTAAPQELWDLVAHHPLRRSSTTNPASSPGTGRVGATEAAAVQVYGIYAEFEAEDSLLASFVVVDGQPVTSAAALGGRDRVWVRSGSVWSEVTVATVDPLTDLALLQPIDGTVPLGLPDLAISTEPVVASQPVMVGYGDVELSGSEAVEAGSPDEGPDGDDGDPEEWVDASDRRGTVYAIGPTAVTPTDHLIHQPIRAAIDPAPGDAGAPLRDREGALVGMTVATNTPQIVAVPIDRVIEAVASLRTIGVGDDTWVGCEVRATSNGLIIESVDEDGPARELRVGDRIVRVGGQAMSHPDQLHYAAREAGVGGSLVITIERNGRRGAIDLSVAARPSDT